MGRDKSRDAQTKHPQTTVKPSIWKQIREDCDHLGIKPAEWVRRAIVFYLAVRNRQRPLEIETERVRRLEREHARVKSEAERQHVRLSLEVQQRDQTIAALQVRIAALTQRLRHFSGESVGDDQDPCPLSVN